MTWSRKSIVKHYIEPVLLKNGIVTTYVYILYFRVRVSMVAVHINASSDKRRRELLCF